MAVEKTASAWDKVLLARSAGRPTAQFYIREIFDGFIELHGDRGFRDDKSIIGGIAELGGTAVTVIGQEKGVSLAEKRERNFGSPHPEGYRKALRLMQQAEKFRRPVLCLIDTQGAFCGVGAEERGQGEAIARNLSEMMKLSVPTAAVVIGEGGSGGALAMAVTNEVAILENAVYSILSPEGFASILWKDGTKTAEAAEVMKMTAQDLKELGVVDTVIEEPNGGAHNSPQETAQNIKAYFTAFLERYQSYTKEELLVQRYERFRKF